MKIQDILKSDLLPVVTGLYETPHLVVDPRGNILFYNNPAGDLLSLTGTGGNIFDILSGPSSELFYSIIKGTHHEDQPLTLQLALSSGESRTVQMRYSALETEEENYFSFIISSDNLQFNSHPEIQVTSEIDEAVNSELLELIRRNYPFTLMGKDLLRKKIDDLKEFFWLKDTSGRFILVNKAFAGYVGMHPSKIEGNTEDKFLPEYLKKINLSIHEYIITTGKGIGISGILFGSSPYTRQRLEIPLINSENKVYLIAGMTNTAVPASESESSDLFEFIPRPAAIINTSGKLLKFTEEFRLVFNIDKKNRNIHFEKLFPSEVSAFISDFIKAGVREEVRPFTGNDLLRKVFIPGYNVFLKKDKKNQVLIYIDELKISQDMQEISNFKGKVYDILIQNNPEPVFVYEKENLRFLEVNQTALSLYGYSKSEFLQMDLTDLYAPEDIQTLLGALNSNITEGVFSGPFRQKKKDGSFIHVEISKFSLKFNNKEAHYNVLRDVSKKLELEKQTQLFRSAFDNTDQLVFVTDSSGFIRFVNNAVMKTLGCSKNDIERTAFAALVKDEERGNINTGIFRSADKGVKKISTDIKNAKGEYIPVELTASPVLDYKNDIDAYTILGSIKKKNGIKEVTKEVVIERIMPAESRNTHSDNALLSSVFHEILTPINVILGFVQELTDSIDVLTPEQKEAADIINQNRVSLLSTMNSIVEYSNIEKKTPEVVFAKVSARNILDNLQNDFSELNKNRGIEIGYGKVVSSFYFDTDKSKFSNLIFLLTSIAGYLNKEKKVIISLYPADKNRFVVTFKNNPDRITPEHLENLIRVFSQWGVNNSEPGIPRLSLRLAGRLVNLFKGELYVRDDNSEAGFIFPVNQFPVEENIKFTEDEETYKPVVTPRKSPLSILQNKAVKETYLNLSQFRCLYIEDQIDSQILFKVQMKELGEIHFAVSFEEALPLLDSKTFDFIVMDINLEGEYNGLDALRIIQKMPEYQDIPVIAVTAYLMPDDRQKFISAGFNEFVPKPIFRDKMIEALEKVFKKSGRK